MKVSERDVQAGVGRVERMTLPLPPTANRSWRHVGSKVLLSADARAYRAQCQDIAAMQYRGPVSKGRVGIQADVHMNLRGDLDNRIKQLLDALHGTVFDDDAQVWEIHLFRHLDRARPRVEVQWWNVAAEAVR